MNLKATAIPAFTFLSKTQATASQLKLLAAKNESFNQQHHHQWMAVAVMRRCDDFNVKQGFYHFGMKLPTVLLNYIACGYNWDLSWHHSLTWRSDEESIVLSTLCLTLQLTIATASSLLSFTFSRLIVRDRRSWLRHHVLLLCIDGLCPKLIFVFGDRSWAIVKKM